VTGAALQTLEGHSDWHSRSVSSVAFSPDGQAVNTLLMSKGWIAEGGTNILWLPIDYRSPTRIAVCNRILALRYLLERVLFLRLKEGLKAYIIQTSLVIIINFISFSFYLYFIKV
jgi:hypothetical protein